MSAPCPLGCEPKLSRPERRRLERELKHVKRQPGLGQGWRMSCGRRNRYPVLETQPRSLDYLLNESDAVARSLGCTCTKAP